MAQSTRTAPQSRSSRSSRTHSEKDSKPSLASIAAVGVVSVLLATQVARLTVAARVADDDPAYALRLAPLSPGAQISAGMAEVGRAAARGTNPGEVTLDRFRNVAGNAPLRSEPFLVEAALADRAGNFRRAEVLLKNARLRDPRSAPALYLLADVSMRQNDIAGALSYMAVLARVLPGAAVQLIPSLAQFAQTPGAEKQLATILKANPKLKRPLLIALSTDPRNASLVMVLAGSDAASTDVEARSWKARLVQGFIQQGDYASAYRFWKNFAGLRGNNSPLLFNGEFGLTPAPPPFDWTYFSGRTGLAEPGGGKLHVLYYERENSSLAYQLLLLAPGTYRLRSPVSDIGAAKALKWTIRCEASGKQILNASLGGEALQFSVPPSCEAQMLTLVGQSQEAPQDIEVQIGPVTLERIGS